MRAPRIRNYTASLNAKCFQKVKRALSIMTKVLEFVTIGRRFRRINFPCNAIRNFHPVPRGYLIMGRRAVWSRNSCSPLWVIYQNMKIRVLYNSKRIASALLRNRWLCSFVWLFFNLENNGIWAYSGNCNFRRNICFKPYQRWRYKEKNFQ